MKRLLNDFFRICQQALRKKSFQNKKNFNFFSNIGNLQPRLYYSIFKIVDLIEMYPIGYNKNMTEIIQKVF